MSHASIPVCFHDGVLTRLTQQYLHTGRQTMCELESMFSQENLLQHVSDPSWVTITLVQVKSIESF